ncbi:MAG: DNA repair exonuclease, partial [Oscillospiraceae bacterium]|nr:DNA repair exonuclease [Oscillospiraceae bacterium]
YEVLEVDAAQEIIPQLPTNTENDICRIVLCGECDRAPELKLLETQLAPRFFALQIKDKTRPVQNIWESSAEDSLRGLFLRRMKTTLDKAETETEREKIIQAVRWTLAALDGGEAVEEI